MRGLHRHPWLLVAPASGQEEPIQVLQPACPHIKAYSIQLMKVLLLYSTLCSRADQLCWHVPSDTRRLCTESTCCSATSFIDQKVPVACSGHAGAPLQVHGTCHEALLACSSMGLILKEIQQRMRDRPGMGAPSEGCPLCMSAPAVPAAAAQPGLLRGLQQLGALLRGRQQLGQLQEHAGRLGAQRQRKALLQRAR